MLASYHNLPRFMGPLPKYGSTWGTSGGRAQQETFISMNRYVLWSRDWYLRDKTSLEDVATHHSLLPNPPLAEVSTRCSKIRYQHITWEPQNGIVASRRKHSLKHDKSPHLLTCRCSTFITSRTTLVPGKGNFFNNNIIPLPEQPYCCRIHVIVNNSSPF